MQNLQELIRNVFARVDDVFHLRQIVDVKNKKIKEKANSGNDNEAI
jgi:hypothetical protein